MSRSTDVKDLNIVICGAAGQGLKTVEKLLSQMFGRTGHFVFSTKEYMVKAFFKKPEEEVIRGQTCSYQILVL